MKHKLRNRLLVASLFAIVAFPVTLFAQNQSIMISEFMAINSNGITDEDGEHSDWIELYNTTDETISLSGWYITDSDINLTKWQFPNISIDPGKYLVIFASEKDRKDPSKNLHTNFKLSGSSEYLALVQPDYSVAYSFGKAYPAQRQDVSFGIYLDQQVFFTTPTPGAENTSGSLPFPPNFSQGRGFYTSPIEVVLSTPVSDGTIYYTTDGTRPTQTTGKLYNGPIRIQNTTPLSAVTINGTGLSSEVISQTYFFTDSILKQPTSPKGYPTAWTQAGSSTIVKADYEMDQKVCSGSEYRSLMDQSLKAIPSLSIVTNPGYIFSTENNATTGGIYIYTGKTPTTGLTWERPASVEYYDPASQKEFQLNCRLMLHGGNSRVNTNTPKHSFKISFKAQYGPSKLNFDLFEEKGAAKEFNALVLRAGYNYSWGKNDATQRLNAQYLQDPFSKTTQLEMGQPSAHNKFVHLYINGLYWGLYNISEKLSNDFMETYLNGTEDQFDVIKEGTTVSSGNTAAWLSLTSQISGAANNTTYQKLQGNNADGTLNPGYSNLIDIDNYIDYMLINYYIGNMDWDKNNWTVARNRITNEHGFRFFVWDAEMGMTTLSTNLVAASPTSGNPTAFLQYLKGNSDFKIRFADHVQKHFYNGGTLTPQATINRYSGLADKIDLAIIGESARWGDFYNATTPYTRNGHWLPRKQYLINTYFPQRSDTVLAQLKKAGLLPSISAPLFTNYGGDMSTAINLGMSSPTGTIYYTTDGSDPRVPITATVASSAKSYTSPLPIYADGIIRARVKTNSEWSAITEAKFIFNGTNAVKTIISQPLMSGNFPNPFHESTQIYFHLPTDGNVQVDVFSIEGRLVKTLYSGFRPNGYNQIQWSPETNESGIYLYRIRFDGQDHFGKIIRK